MSSAGGSDAFASKYGPNGSLVWARRFGAAGAETTEASAFASEGVNGYLYVTGSFEGSVDFGNGITLTSAGGSDIYIVKLNATDGNTVFAKRIGSLNGREYALSLAVANDQVFIGGFFTSVLDFDPGAGTAFRTPAGKSTGNSKLFPTDGYLLQLDSNLNYVSVYQFGGSGDDRAGPIVAEATSSAITTIYFNGSISGTVDVDPGSGIKNATGSFIAKFSVSTTSPTWSPDWVER